MENHDEKGTILVADDETSAVIIDPVDHNWERDLAHLERLGLKLAFVLETHAHADHVTSAGKLVEVTGARAAVPSGCGIGFFMESKLVRAYAIGKPQRNIFGGFIAGIVFIFQAHIKAVVKGDTYRR